MPIFDRLALGRPRSCASCGLGVGGSGALVNVNMIYVILINMSNVESGESGECSCGVRVWTTLQPHAHTQLVSHCPLSLIDAKCVVMLMNR